MTAPDPIVEQVRADLQRRAELGLRKYGCTVSDNPLPLREWLQHAYEEALDLAVYLRRAMRKVEYEGLPVAVPSDEDLRFLCAHPDHSLIMVEIMGAYVPMIVNPDGCGPVVPPKDDGE